MRQHFAARFSSYSCFHLLRRSGRPTGDRPPSEARLIMRRRSVLLLSLAAALLAFVPVYYAVFAGEKVPRYLTAEVKRTDLEDAVLAGGILHAAKQVDVGAQVSGQLKSIGVELGDKVRKGQLLAQIDPTLSQHALRQAQATEKELRAQRRAAAARLVEAKRIDGRQRQLLSIGAVSREAAETAQALLEVRRSELDSLEAQLEKARIEIERAQANVGYTRILAPIDGEVVAIVTQEGQTVIAEQQAPVILKLAELDTMTVKAQVSEADVVRIAPGQRAYFTILGDPGKRYEGRLRAVEPAPHDFADAPTSANAGAAKGAKAAGTAVFYHALFDVPNPDRRLRISMTTQVSIVLETASQALTIPASALGEKTEDGAYTIRVLDTKGRAQTRSVRVGINNNVRAEVVAGLGEGEQVIIGEAPTEPSPSAGV
jgi:macrolide-specific efflux system membrane fusion protein